MLKVHRSVGEWIIVVIIVLLLRAFVSLVLPFVEVLPYSCFAVCMLFLAPGGIETGVQNRNYDNGYHYYFHRGFPIVFSGVSRVDTKLPGYAIPLPYYTSHLYDDTHVRIIHLPAAILN